MQLPRKMSGQNVNPEKPNPETGNREHKPTGNEIRFAGDERKDKLYEPKHKQKLVRVLTVVAYVIFVSMGAILLSLYYTFVWDPKDVSVKIRGKPECADTKLAYPLTTPPVVNETQIEKITTKLVTSGKEQAKELVTTTTKDKTALPKQNLLTVLARTTTLSSIMTSSSDPPISTDSNTQERITNASVKSDRPNVDEFVRN